MASIPARLPYNWIPDERCTTCNLCKCVFSIITRRHHCRSCGKIFCYNCCFQYQSLPSYMPHTHRRFISASKVKVCNTCYTDIMYIKHSKKYILIMSLLPLDIQTLVSCRVICKRWKISVDAVISVFKAIQYKSSYQSWSGIERRLLRTHWREFRGHSRLITCALRGLCGVGDISEMARFYKDSKKTIPCKHMLCNQTCFETFSVYDLFELMCAFPSDKILQCQEMESWIGTELSKLKKEWLIIFIPWFLQSNTIQTQRIVANNILPVVCDDISLVYKFFFECKLLISSEHKCKTYYRSLLDRLMSMISPVVKQKILSTEKLIRQLRTPDRMTEYDFNGIPLPFDPTVTVIDVHTVNIKRLNTHTKPWVVPIETDRGLMHVLVKNDDIRKDRFVTDIMRILVMMDERLDFKLYSVLCWSALIRSSPQ
jgi:hypothetical protein